MLGLALLLLGMATSAVLAAEPSVVPEPSPAKIIQSDTTYTKPLVVARSCAGECQAQHDRCRVETKGSRTCDEARQHCLQICLQKKKK
jgi:hypothetical protein